MRLNPGNKVRITDYVFENIDVVDIVVATKDSVGTVLSFKEYWDYYVNKHYLNKQVWYDHYLSLVRDWVNDCAQYPIRFDTIVPPSEDFISYWKERGVPIIECMVGKIEILPVKFLEKIA